MTSVGEKENADNGCGGGCAADAPIERAFALPLSAVRARVLSTLELRMHCLGMSDEEKVPFRLFQNYLQRADCGSCGDSEERVFLAAIDVMNARSFTRTPLEMLREYGRVVAMQGDIFVVLSDEEIDREEARLLRTAGFGARAREVPEVEALMRARETVNTLASLAARYCADRGLVVALRDPTLGALAYETFNAVAPEIQAAVVLGRKQRVAVMRHLRRFGHPDVADSLGGNAATDLTDAELAALRGRAIDGEGDVAQ